MRGPSWAAASEGNAAEARTARNRVFFIVAPQRTGSKSSLPSPGTSEPFQGFLDRDSASAGDVCGDILVMGIYEESFGVSRVNRIIFEAAWARRGRDRGARRGAARRATLPWRRA